MEVIKWDVTKQTWDRIMALNVRWQSGVNGCFIVHDLNDDVIVVHPFDYIIKDGDQVFVCPATELFVYESPKEKEV